MSRPLLRPITTPAAGRMPRPDRPALVSLLTDWGSRDPSAAIVRGVIAGIVPGVLILDISHEVDKFNIRHGALLLSSAVAWLPVGAHVAVIDPGVGTPRRPIALQVERGDYLVGPDNGLLLPAAERLGGIIAAHLLEAPEYRLPGVSATFHGRDIFAPAAAHLAAGVPLASLGAALRPTELVSLDWPAPRVEDGVLHASVVYVDTFGNVKLSAMADDARRALGELDSGDAISAQLDGRSVALRWAATFGETERGGDVLLEDSYGRLAIARNQGNAAAALRIADGATIVISRAAADGARGSGQAADASGG